MSRWSALIVFIVPVLFGCGDSSGTGAPPVARLTAPTFCHTGSTITLDGTGSSDPDDDIVLYRFIIAEGTAVQEIARSHVSYHCVVEGLIEVALVVVDLNGNLGEARQIISVRPQ